MWTETTRKQNERSGGRYASDLTDAEFGLIEPSPRVARICHLCTFQDYQQSLYKRPQNKHCFQYDIKPKQGGRQNILFHLINSRSRSILDLKGHREIYPAITEVAKVTVAARTLDALMAEKGLASADFNILNIDIQGAELLGLKGAENTLTDIEAVNTEVNFDELYEGGVLIHELDDFLALRGFKRVAITTPFHHAWGDAFYVRA